MIVFDINARAIVTPSSPTLLFPVSAVQLAKKIGFRQRWSLFTEVRDVGNGYFEVQHISATGSKRVFSRIPEVQPFAFLEVGYPSHRWKKFLLTIEHPEREELRQAFANYLCRHYADAGEKIVLQFHSGLKTTNQGKKKDYKRLAN